VAHYNLGFALREQGRFADALAAFRKGHELGSRRQAWPFPSAQLVRDAEQLVALDARLAKVLRGEAKSAGARESIVLAQFCQIHKKRYAAAVRFYTEAFVAEPRLSGDQPSAPRCHTAGAAALAGCGGGQDAVGLPEMARARLRQQALDWLRADLSAQQRVLAKGPAMAPPVIVQSLQHWLQDTAFAGVRGRNALAKLPEAERAPWQQLWADVADTRARALTAVAAVTIPFYTRELERLPNNAALRRGRGDCYVAVGDHARALADYSKIVELEPKNAEAWKRVAWLLTTCPDARLRAPDRAHAMANKAVALAPKDGNCWLALAWANYRTGNWQQALEAADKALLLRNGGDCGEWFLLAMVHARLGNHEKARQWYDQANRLMVTRHHDDWPHFRAEAAALLGIPVPPAPKNNEKRPGNRQQP
jgi:tetratricopeptide (TPR) repeat protein